MEEYVAKLKATPVAAGHDEVYYPGEIEARNDLRQRADGLYLPEDTRADLQKTAEATGVDLSPVFG